ncbi:carboxylate-amine ligase [Mycobacteroides abscessus]|nr:carboxylate-amine ligase [Mycobacteroides abscessus]QOF43383.1 carboxylate-amine ligase [Mycobacteroides abscessus]QOF48082.1 carboxylate-amine ligase [Mycobacteroides abscessus]
MAIGRTIFVVSAPMALIAVFVWGASNKHHKVRSAPPDSTTSEPNKTHHDVGSANRGLTRRPLRRGTDPPEQLTASMGSSGHHGYHLTAGPRARRSHGMPRQSALSKPPRTLGIEEEFHLVDLTTRRLATRAPELLPLLPDGYVAELQSCVVETNGSVVSTLPELRADLTARRRVLVDTAARLGLGVVAAGAAPLSIPSEMHVTPTPRYQQMLADYQLLAREQLICGTQIHVGIDDRDECVLVAGRVAAYVPTLLALSASSPFWSDGSDTGYSSVRTLVWQRWPTTGLAPPATSAAEYDTLISNLIATGVITDAGMSYFDVRPALRTPTLELRVCDSCPRADTIVLIAALFRALVEREIEGLRSGAPAAIVVPPLGRAALWRAARSGLEGDLVDLIHPASRPAGDVVTDLVHMLRPQLEACGDWQTVEELARTALAEGSSAARQRRAKRIRNSLLDVVDHLIAETANTAPCAHGTLATPPNGFPAS